MSRKPQRPNSPHPALEYVLGDISVDAPIKGDEIYAAKLKSSTLQAFRVPVHSPSAVWPVWTQSLPQSTSGTLWRAQGSQDPSLSTRCDQQVCRRTTAGRSLTKLQ